MILNNGRNEFFNTSDAGRSAKGSLPSATTQTGTISSTGTSVTGTGTVFKTELKEGGWLYANDEIRRIVTISTDTELTVASAFGADLVGAAVEFIQTRLLKEVSVSNYGGANGKIGGSVGGNTTLPSGESVNPKNEAGLEPIAYDATGTTFLIRTQY